MPSTSPHWRSTGRTTSKLDWPLLVGLLLGPLVIIGCGKKEASQAKTGPQASGTAAGMEPSTDRIAMARNAVQTGDLPAAEKLLRQQMLENPDDAVALELSGDIAAQQQDLESAVMHYREAIDRAGEKPAMLLLDKFAQATMMTGRPFDSMYTLQRASAEYPNNPQIRYDLAGLAAMLGMAEVAVPPLSWLARHGQGDAESLILLADPGRVEADEAMCQKALEKCPSDLRAHFSLARMEAADMNWRAVASRLEPVVKKHPDFVPAYALYGRALIELGQSEQVSKWRTQIPVGAEDSPTYWFAAGLWSREQGNVEEAARAFWEAVRRDEPGQVEALNHLMTCLAQIGRDEDAKQVADRIQDFAAMRDALATHHERKSRSQQSALQVAKAMMKLGRVWEAEAWARMAASLPDGKVASIREDYIAIRGKLTAQTPWQDPLVAIGNAVDLQDLPVADWASVARPASSADRGKASEFRFQDQASQRKLIHTCEISPAAASEGHWIYQSVGGGAGVIDYDLDGWPDFALAMLDGQPLKNDSGSNRLMRSLAGSFRDVGEAAGYRDFGFAQGITVSDYNDDGFPDIFDSNIGVNRLFRNNGDGTFTDVTEQAGLRGEAGRGEAWTTSSAIADIDGDGYADLFEVAYCGGTSPYTSPCRSADSYSTCPPLHFEAEADHCWRGVGDGTFVDATAPWLEQLTPGRGLGLIVGNLDERTGLDVYVANDMTVNHLWSGADQEGSEFQLTELGAIRGLGSNGRSFSQASMGMAAGDPDNDGDIDLFLTHFADDHNTYYEQVSPGLWSDRSFPVGLAEPSMKLLGFGTEFADFDNDGGAELIVTNGHVDEVDREDIAYQMPAQLFQRARDGRWQQVDNEAIGEYFRRDHLGRALATVDANRDGRVDFLITHLYSPVALLINETDAGRSIGLELRATASQRDAIGTTISMQVGTTKVNKQLLGGDGYMCTNQRRLSVGMGPAGQATDVEIIWPSGLHQSIPKLDAGQDYLLVEGCEQPFSLFPHD